MSGVRLIIGKRTDCFGNNEREGVLVQELREMCDSEGFPNDTRWETVCTLVDAADCVTMCPSRIYHASLTLSDMKERGVEPTLADELQALQATSA